MISVLYLLNILLFNNPGAQDSLQVINLSYKISSLDLTNHVEYYEDKSGKLTLKDIVDSTRHIQFIKNSGGALNFGYTHSVYWIRFKVKCFVSGYAPFVIQQNFANMHYIDFYQLYGTYLIKSIKTGVMRPTNSREFQSNRFTFFIHVPQNQVHTILMRFQNEASMTITLSLFKMDDFFNYAQLRNYFFGGFIGILLILMAYNIVNYFSLKDISYLYFCASVISIVFFFLSYSGTAYMYIWPDKPVWNKYSVDLFNILILISFIKFAQTFLRIKKITPLLNKIMNGLILFTIINIILIPFVAYFYLIQSSIYISSLTFPMIFIAGIFSLKTGYVPAKYYLLSFSGVVIIALLLLATRLGLLSPNINSEYGFIGATFFMIILLSQGLVSRVNILQREKERADRQVKASEERFKAIVETTNDFIWETDQKGKYTYASPNVNKILGYKPDELIGMSPFDLMPVKEAKKIKEKFKKIVKSKLSLVNLENINIKKNGDHVVLETSGVPFFDNQGRIMGYRGVDRDITERKKFRDDLLKSENNVRALLNATSAIAFLTDVNLNIIALNKAYANKINKRPEEIIGHNTLDFVSGPLAKLRRKKIEQVFQTRQSLIWEDKGPRGIYENTVYPVFDRNKKITNLAFYIVDISEKRRAEEQIRILSTSVEQSPFSIIVFSKKGEIIYVNRKSCEMSGYTFKELINKNIRNFHPEIPYNKIIFNALSGKDVKGEYQVKNIDGEYYWESVNVFPIKNENDKITFLIAINEDITERKSLEDQLIQAQKMEAIGTLAGGIAHDFNNLLTIINGYSDLMLEKVQDEKFRNALSSIRYASQKAEDLTRQILTFSKKQIYQPKIIDVNDLINNLNKIIPRLIGEDIKIKILLSENLNRIKADPSQYEQIILNLIVNARDAINQKTNKTGDKQILIETENILLDEFYTKTHIDCKPGPHVCLSVTDTGIGMTKDVQLQIFEPFFTTKEQGKGTGLGLATVFGIVKQNNGSIFLYSEPGKGTTFKIYWPVTDEDITYKRTDTVDNEQLFGSERILFVEDNIEILNFAITTLKEFGYHVLSASDGKKALELVRKNNKKPDILITDVIMPDMNGKELSEKIQTLIPDIKIIFTSGYANDHIVQSGELTHNMNFIQKPFTVNTLLAKIRNIYNS